MMKTISCIIPAYNEAGRIREVLNAVTATPAITEVLVVDDGSSDGTSAVAEEFRDVNVMRLWPNQGKSAAVANAIERATGEYLLFIDADLLGLTPRHIESLISPVFLGCAEVSFSLRFKMWMPYGIDPISGERLVPRSLLAGLTETVRRLRPFALETFMNGLIIDQNMRIAVVPWTDVQSPLKSKKYSFWKGIRGDIQMVRDILSVNSVFGYVRQVITIRKRRVPPVELRSL